MSILHIQQDDDLQQLTQTKEPFACLLHHNCLCDARVFQNQHCAGIALVGNSSFARPRRKHIAELALSQDFGCPVRLFSDENKAQEWLTKQLPTQQ